jgi:CheY-like chemotaxis protein
MSSEQSVTEVPAQQAPQASGDEQFGGAGGFEMDENGQRVPHGMGQSKSSRRRRRKRKNKSGGGEQAANPANGSGGEAGGDGQAVASMQAGAEPQVNGQAGQNQGFRQNGQGRSFQGAAQNPSQQNNGAPGGTKRWKKKFRDRDRQRSGDNPGNQQNAQAANGSFRGPDTHQPGNSAGGFKRKGGFGGGGGKQQRGPRSFVGPMDHSYRVVNGNVFDAGSTVESFGNGRGRSLHTGDSQPIDYSQGRPIPIAPDAPTKIYFFIEDLFFIAKIQETARKLGVKVGFIKNEKEQIAALTDAAEDDRPGLIVFDLNNANAKPLTLIPKLKTKLKKTTSIIGFLSHLQGDLKAKAVEAGCDTVMPRAAFSQNLPNLLRRYGIEEIEEPNYNQ